MKYNTKDFKFNFPETGDSDVGVYFYRRTVNISKCLLNQDETKKIVIPDGVEILEAFSFANFINLEEILFPASLKVICEGAFECCKSLKTVVFANPVTIEKDAFRFCDNLEEVIVNETSGHKEILIHNSSPDCIPEIDVIFNQNGNIHKNAFRDCPNLKSIQLCENMER